MRIVEYLINYGINSEALNESLITAITGKNYGMIIFLVEHGANVNYNNGEPLYKAVYINSLPVIVYLVEHGAFIHLNDNQALRLAFEKDYQKIIDYLGSFP